MTPNELFRQGLTTLGLDLDDRAIDRLGRYLDELQKWNKRINLVAAAPQKTLIESHFLDSLTLLPLLGGCPLPGLLDVGSGAGFPGLVLKIARPDLQVTLVEPRQKRTSFLRQVIRILDLQGINVLETRLEEGNAALAGWRNDAPLVTSRAFASIRLFLETAAPFTATGGRVICMKGPRAAAELAEWHEHSADSPFRLAETIKTALPFSGTPRQLLVFVKGGPP